LFIELTWAVEVNNPHRFLDLGDRRQIWMTDNVHLPTPVPAGWTDLRQGPERGDLINPNQVLGDHAELLRDTGNDRLTRQPHRDLPGRRAQADDVSKTSGLP